MERRPNVVLITTDQQRWDTLGCYGNRVVRTPHLDGLAAEGVRFERAYVTNPVCTPSRATLLTGRYPSSHGAYNVGVSLPDDVPTLSGMLGAAGYDTALIGKAHFQPFGADPARSVESNRGAARDPALWREWHGPYYGFWHVELSMGHGPGGTEGHYGEWLRQTAPEVLTLFPKAAALAPSSVPIGSWKSAVPIEYHSTTWTADRTIAYLEARSESQPPFFLWTSFQDPHHPFCPPRPYCDMYPPEAVSLPSRGPGELDRLPPHFRHAYEGTQDALPYARGRLSGTDPKGYVRMTEAHAREVIAHYYGMVSLIDDAVGRILAALERLGLARDTVVVFGTDHGELLGDHGLWLKGPFLYEGLIRVPYLWRYPAA
ncbi:MAG TPA: sulfatase-like hydrolase/transferase, partial [Chloroflexota bacterium]|nr:sulfatase-like hydrolase/transferase [Chloroflexota bacterium]